MMGPQARTGVQQNPQGSFAPAHLDILDEETQRLDSSLEMESARIEDNQNMADLEAELEEMELRLKQQEALRESLINEVNEAKRELERVQREEKSSDPGVLNAAVTASKVHNDVKDMKEKPLQQDFEDLKSCCKGRLEDDQNPAELEAKLEEMELRLKKQETLRETLINEAEEAQRELERLEREEMFSDPAELYAADIASKFYNSVKNMKEKTLQQEFEELKVAHLLSREAFVAGIQAERKKTEAVQEELDQLQTSYKELRCKYEADISLVRQEAKREKDANIEREKENLKLVNNLRAEKEELFQKMAREIIILRKREKQMLKKLDQVHVSHKELKGRFETDNMDLKQQVETYQKQIKQERKAHLEKSEKDKASLDTMRAEFAVLQQNATTEFQILQDKESSAQAELEKVNGLYQELNCRYENEVTAFKQQAEKYQQEIRCVKNDLERAKEDLLLLDTLRPEEEDIQQKHITDSQEEEEDSQDQVDPVKVLSQEVSSEEKLSGETLSGCSNDPESTEETEITGETVLEDLDNPDTKIMQDGSKGKYLSLFGAETRDLSPPPLSGRGRRAESVHGQSQLDLERKTQEANSSLGQRRIRLCLLTAE
ncbi:myosin heavy chain, cardiac muscle isoform-like [Xiphophorus hellerii]|uniref:myosin heavy chain, cardiac muscle isoform-like n=1 Tax=Xiphophorus hellerii TaxID=8084 RepID=UPI0013B3E63C|nr:myosin heavy chain, cardiac muscle isoform-like [Xiphophorus hellerii]